MMRLCVSPTITGLVTALLLNVAVASPAAGQQRVADHPRVVEALNLLDVWIDAEQAYEKIPGMSVAVVYDQQVVWAKGYGFAHVTEAVPATRQTLYKACSIVKLFTATGVMQLRDQRQLALEDAVATHLPWFDIDNPFPEAGPVTIEGLLTHSSGLPPELPYAYWTGPDYPFPTLEQIIGRVSELTMTHPTRTHSQYSNLGMTLAGEIISAVSGTPFDVYIRRRVFDPLGMNDTYIDRSDALLGDRLATGYTVLQRDGTRKTVPSYQVHGLAPAAGLISTVEDLARFASWQFRALEGAGDGVLDRNTLRTMHDVQWMQPDGWSRSGYGYQTWAENDRSFVGHAGACPGYESKLLLRPQEKIATIVMTNSQGPNVDGYAQRAYDILAPAIRAALNSPEATTGSAASGARLDRFTGTYQRPFGSESAVLEWQGGLAVLRLPTGNPRTSMERFEPVDDTLFRRAGPRGESVDRIRFEEDGDGHMRMWRNHQYSVRVP